MITLLKTKLQVKRLAPYNAPMDIKVPPSSPPATTLEITSGEPFARASRDTPVRASENLNLMLSLVRATERYSSLAWEISLNSSRIISI